MQFQNYTAFSNVSDEQAAKLFKVLMVEQAADWIDSLLTPPEGQTANLEYFVQNCRQRYQTPETLMMKMVQELYSPTAAAGRVRGRLLHSDAQTG